MIHEWRESKLYKAFTHEVNKHEQAKLATHHYDELPNIFKMNLRKETVEWDVSPFVCPSLVSSPLKMLVYLKLKASL